MAEKIWLLQQGDDSSQIYCVDKSPTILGRSSSCDIVISDASVSSQHIQFTINGKALHINELQSSSGTLLNGKPLSKAILKPFIANKRHKLQVGGVSFELFFDAKPQPDISDEQSTSGEEDEPKWYFSSDGQEVGPLTLAQVYAAVDSGSLRPTDDFWQSGAPTRYKAFEVEGLFSESPASKISRSAEISIDSERLQCPYCWNHFKVEDLLFISNHPELLGDPVLGPDEPQRFLPSRFTAEGLALDAMGVVCPDMACPRCHMRIPSSYLDHSPLFMSIVGAPASGKSYFLASANWTMRTTLPKLFGVKFTDVDAVSNQWLNDYEEKLFFQADSAGRQSIAKTDTTAKTVYRQVLLNGMNVILPLPVLFSLDFTGGNGFSGQSGRRSMVLYDNAGEHFQAGTDTAATPVTKHLIHAEGIMFLFDPTEDPRFRQVLSRGEQHGMLSGRSQRQDILLVEMISRIRKHLGMSFGDRLNKNLVVSVSKADLLSEMLDIDTPPWIIPADGGPAVLDIAAIHRMSAITRELMDRHAPEIVATVETFAENVVYIPNSALGHNPGPEGVRPCDIKPKWVEVPFLYILAQKGYIAISGQDGTAPIAD